MLFFVPILLSQLVIADHRILENYEKKLNEVQSTTSGRVVKRYRCVEEYVTVDEETKLGRTFTTVKPPAGAVVEKEKRRKAHGVRTTQVELKPPKKTKKKGDSRPKTNDELIEEMLRSPPHIVATPYSPIRPQIRRSPTTEEPRREIFSHEQSRGVPISQLSPPLRPYYTSNYVDDYDGQEEEEDYFEDTRRRSPYRRSRPLPHIFARDASRRVLRPVSFRTPVRQPPLPFVHPLPVQPQRVHPILPRQPLPVETQPPSVRQQPPSPLPPVQPPSIPPPTLVPQMHFEESTAENCIKMSRMAKDYKIGDLVPWSRNNCGLIQMLAPGATCEQIWHFIDSCQKKHFF